MHNEKEKPGTERITAAESGADGVYRLVKTDIVNEVTHKEYITLEEGRAKDGTLVNFKISTIWFTIMKETFIPNQFQWSKPLLWYHDLGHH